MTDIRNSSAIAEFVWGNPLADTHEHLYSNEDFLAWKPDILELLAGHYWGADLRTAQSNIPGHQWGIDWSSPLLDPEKHSLSERYALLADAIERAQFTSNGRVARNVLRELFDQDDFSLPSLEAAQKILETLHVDGARLRTMRDVAKLDHCQTDNWSLKVTPDTEDAAFFLRDLCVHSYTHAIHDNTYQDIKNCGGGEVTTFDELNESISSVFRESAAKAIAVKSAHAYSRTLQWKQRTEAEAKAAFERTYSDAANSPLEDRLCLSDWNLGRIVEEAGTYHLPVKIHTGFYAGNFHMRMDRIRPGHLCELLETYQDKRFVLMHMGYPYEQEMIAMAKHFPNVWVDLCWAWSIDEQATQAFVRRFLNTVPYNKLFAFGGDTANPFAVVGYAHQARKGLINTLNRCVEARDFTESDALKIGEHLMLKNAYECFDFESTQAALHGASKE